MESAAAEQLILDEEYRALTTAVGILECSKSGILEVSGKNAIPFLNGLVTADLKILGEGRGALAAFLNVQGKVVALARIYRRSHGLLLEVDHSNHEKILNSLSRYIPAGDFQISDLSDRLGLVSLQGPRANQLLEALLSKAPPDDPYSNFLLMLIGAEVLVTRHARLGTSGFDLFIPREELSKVLEAVSQAAVSLGGRAVSKSAVEIARIDAGIACEPNEVNDNHILLETGLDEAVSYTKGCYLGQEIIARIHWRGQPARRVRKLTIEAPNIPPQGAELIAEDGKRIGELTSVASIPAGNRPRMAGLGYVHRYYLNEGTRFTLRTNGTDVGFAEICHGQ